ncbi:hypothetical protein Bca52824_018914 [Brassica carinata]|uniref:Dihydrolipoyl dehydrogenase n=1 Tax=Brassica carinata TaxID=52824 RepID=A0A8X8AZX1_BRACI|nr:hypothetical protein Bca52824_018914 [Brassica carinata]
MQSAIALPFSQTSLTRSNRVLGSTGSIFSTPRSLQFCGLRREAFCSSPSNHLTLRSDRVRIRSTRFQVSAAATTNGAPPKSFDYDLIIIGAGVGGHGAALHAVEKGLKTAIIEGDVVGGTCVNRGCVPSKALLAVSGRMRELQNEHHMKSFGLQVSTAGYDRQGVADHANNLATKIRNNLTNSMKALGVDILTGFGSVLGPQKVKYGKDNIITAKNIIIATGSVPFVPKGIEVDGKTVITSDHALKLESVPDWIAIVGSGYIGLEFSDVYTALGRSRLPLREGFVPFVANVLIRAGKESGETSDMEVVLGGLASLNDEIEWFKSEGSKWGVDFSTVVAQKANQEYSRFLEALMSSEVEYSVVMTAFWAIEAVYQESFAHSCNRWGNDGFRQYCLSVKNIAERCLENASREALVEAEDVLVRVLEHEVAFWEMSRGGQ